jgi:NAD(P)-dependent dehydrogenase (short-subunit alcohol dehydrogenase family)
MENALNDKTILVTGGSGRLGDTLMATIEREGGRVLFTTRDAAKAEKFNQLAIQKGSAARAMPLAMQDETEVRAFIAEIIKQYGKIDGFVHNAYATLPFMPVGKVPWSYWSDSMRVSIAACETIAAALVDAREKTGIQSIVNIASIYGVRAPQFPMYEPDREPNPVYYGTVKAAVLALTRYLAALWGALGVRVNAVTPGGILAGQQSDFLAKYGATVPQGRMVTPQEVSDTIVFLLSDRSSGITGANIMVDAGKSIW